MNTNDFEAIRALRRKHPRLEIGFTAATIDGSQYGCACGITDHDIDYNISVGYGYGGNQYDAMSNALATALFLAGALDADGKVPDQTSFRVPTLPDLPEPAPPPDTRNAIVRPHVEAEQPPTSLGLLSSVVPNEGGNYHRRVWSAAAIYGWHNAAVLDAINERYSEPEHIILLTSQLSQDQVDDFVDFMSSTQPPPPPT